ncbi:MAG: efflux RND transporter periplasmic adaptor subunit [Prevotella sp.]|jgi:HlyD family secretion protein
MKPKKISTIWLIVGGCFAIAIIAWLFTGNKKEEQVSFVTEAVAPANIQNSITATGTVEPVDTVSVGTQVSGIIDKIYVDFNSTVKKGQVLAMLDTKNLTSTLNSAKANLQSAQADLQSAQATLSYQRANYNRYKALYQKGLISADEYESTRLSYKQAVEQVAMMKQNVVSAQESVKTAQTNLGYATITSPIDGVVINKYVAEGQTVAASYNTPELFGVAKDLRNMQVLADVDEADIGDVKPGESVMFTVDAYPDDTFQGTVKQVRLGATTTNNVVTYKVVISTTNADMKLKPGLTANVTIYTQQKAGVLSVPTKALRFTPAKETVGNMKIKDISNAKNKVWTIEGNNIVAHRVNIGMTDGTHTQIISGIKQGQKVITGVSVKTEDDQAQTSQSTTESSPFQPGPHKNNKKK